MACTGPYDHDAAGEVLSHEASGHPYYGGFSGQTRFFLPCQELAMIGILKSLMIIIVTLILYQDFEY